MKIHIENLTVVTTGTDAILNAVKNLELQMSQTTDVIDALVASVTANTSATESAVQQFGALTAHVDELLAAAAAAPTLEETNALIAEAQAAVSEISANSQRLIDAAHANTPLEAPAV